MDDGASPAGAEGTGALFFDDGLSDDEDAPDTLPCAARLARGLQGDSSSGSDDEGGGLDEEGGALATLNRGREEGDSSGWCLMYEI